MALETAEFISELNTSYPTNQDQKKFGDNHLNMLKEVLQQTFAGWGGYVLILGTEAQGATANEFVLTASPAPSALKEGIVVFFATHTNTGSATFKINALTAKAIKNINGTDLEAGDITTGLPVVLIYSGTYYYLLSGNDRASLHSATLTGTPTAPTAATGTSGNQLATLDFVIAAALAATLPGVNPANAGKLISNDGTTSLWTDEIDGTVVTMGADGAIVSTNGIQVLDNKKLLTPGLGDETDATKAATIVLSGVTAGQNRTITLEDKDTLWMTPGWVKLSEVTASGSATVDLETTLNGTYDAYVVSITGLTIAAASAALYARLKIAGSYHSGANEYNWAWTTKTTSADGDDAQMQLVAALSNGAGISLSGEFFIYTPSSTALYKLCKWELANAISTSVADTALTSGVGLDKSGLGAVTGIRFLASSGNIAAGTFTLFGIRKS